MKWRIAKVGVVVAAALCISGLIGGVGTPLARPDRGDRARLLVVDIGSFSWESILSLPSGVSMSYLASLFAGDCAYGDVIAQDYASDSAILASLLTGRFPANHGITNDAIHGPMDGDRTPDARLVWDRIHRAGQPVAVVGFPIWRPLAGRDALVIPPPRSFAGCGVVFRDGMSPRDPSYVSLIASADSVADALRERFGEGLALPDAVLVAMRAGIGDDLTIAAMAEQAVRTVRGAHLFVRLSGLSMVDAAIRDAGTERMPEPEREMLLGRYHVFLDGLLKRLDVAMGDERKTVFIVSENANRRGPIRYRPYFPALQEWPAMGFFVAAGGNIRRAETPESMRPVDLAVTLLYLAAAPLPASMDGVILYGILHDDFYFKHALRTAP